MQTSRTCRSQRFSRHSLIVLLSFILFVCCSVSFVDSKKVNALAKRDSRQKSRKLVTRYLKGTTTDEEVDDEDRFKVGVAELLPVGNFEKKIGVEYDIAVKFVSVLELDYNEHVQELHDADKDVVIVLEFFSEKKKTNLEDVIDGLYDKYLLKFIADWKKNGNKMIKLRPLHEMNSDWYEWGTYRGGTNTTENFILAYQHVWEVFKRGRANFEMQLAYNCDNPDEDDAPFSDWWPGEKYVDIILCSAYNRYGTSKWQTKWESFSDVFSAGYKRMEALHDTLPLGVGETSTVDEGGSKEDWFKQAFEQIQDEFPRVAEVDFFLINKDGDDEGNWGLNTKSEFIAFGNEIKKLKGIEVTTTTTSDSTMTSIFASETSTSEETETTSEETETTSEETETTSEETETTSEETETTSESTTTESSETTESSTTTTESTEETTDSSTTTTESSEETTESTSTESTETSSTETTETSETSESDISSSTS